MQNNILRDTNINKIYLIYTNANSSKKKENVKLRYMGDKECYFVGSIPPNFVKPKPKSPVEIWVYTTDGIYKTTVAFSDTNLTLNEVLYEVKIPQTWNFIQLRQGSRKMVTLPGVLKFNDDTELNFETFDLAIGGFSFVTEKPLASIYQKFPCTCTIEFPKELIMNFPDRKLTTEAKVVRLKEQIEGEFGKKFYALRFLNLSNEESMLLKNYLMGIE